MVQVLSAETKEQLNATLPQLFKLAVMMLNDYAKSVEEEANGTEVIPPNFAATQVPPAVTAIPGPTVAAVTAIPGPTVVEATRRRFFRDRGNEATALASTPATVLEPEAEEPEKATEGEELETPATPPKDRGKNATN